jgi:hypothetical protein
VRTLQWVAAFVAVLGLSACGNPPPTSPSSAPTVSDLSAGSFGTLAPSRREEPTASDFASCLARAGNASCFSAPQTVPSRLTLLHPESVASVVARTTALATDSVPNPPTNLNFSVSSYSSETSIYLYWRPAATGPTATTYVVEAGFSAGSSDLAAFATGNAFTSYTTTVSGAGTFYVRVRAVASGATSAPSNEVIVTVADPRLPHAPYLSTVSANGSIVTLGWYAPFSGPSPTSYVIQASSRAGGPSDLANFATGNTSTTLTATGVPPGTYFVRVLAANSAGIGAPSQESSLIVLGPIQCTAPPSAPGNLVPLITGTTVILGWSLSTGLVTSYIVEVGSASGLVDLARVDTGSTAGTATFTTVPRGTYYLRVRGANACGPGSPSSEVLVVVR